MKSNRDRDIFDRKNTAYNGRFGASGAVARPKVCANLEVLRPSKRQCKPRLRQAAGTLYASRAKARWRKPLRLEHLRQRGKTLAKPSERDLKNSLIMSWFKKEENRIPNRKDYRKFLLQKEDIARHFRMGDISETHLEKFIDELETINKVCAEKWNCSISDAWERYKINYAEMKEAELNPVPPREAIVRLAEKAYEFFEQEYNNSNEIHSIIKTYSELLAIAQQERFHYRDNTDEVINKIIKPMHLYYDKLDEWIFNTIQSSLIKKFPMKAHLIRQAYKLYDDDDNAVMNAICNELSNKLMSGFVIELKHSLKKYHEIILKNNYPEDYEFFSNYKDGLEAIWDELYGRSVKIVFDCLQSMGLDISLIDKNKIIYNKVVVSSEGTAPINIIKNIIFGDIDVSVK